MKKLAFYACLPLLAACAAAPSLEAPQSPIADDGGTPIKARPASAAPLGHSAETTSVRRLSEEEADDSLLTMAEKMRRAGDTQSAAQLYARAAAKNPQSITALKNLAEMAEQRKAPREALQAWRGVLAAENDHREAQLGIARNLSQLGLHEKAIKELQKISGDDNAEKLNLLGQAHLGLGHDEEALAAFEKALTLEPDNLRIQNNLGFALIMAGRLADAITLLEKTVESPRATQQHRQNLALAYGLAGREDDARKIALEDLSPADVEKNIATYRAMRAKARSEKKGDTITMAPKAEAAQKNTRAPKEKIPTTKASALKKEPAKTEKDKPQARPAPAPKNEPAESKIIYAPR